MLMWGGALDPRSPTSPRSPQPLPPQTGRGPQPPAEGLEQDADGSQVWGIKWLPGARVGRGWESKSLLRSGTGRGADWGCRGLSRRFGLRGWGPVWLPRGEWASSWGYGGAWLLSGRLRGDLGEIRSCAGTAAETTEPAHPGQGTGALKERAAGSGGGHGRKGLRPQLGAVSAVERRPRTPLPGSGGAGVAGRASWPRPAVPTRCQQPEICWAGARIVWPRTPGLRPTLCGPEGGTPGSVGVRSPAPASAWACFPIDSTARRGRGRGRCWVS